MLARRAPLIIDIKGQMFERKGLVSETPNGMDVGPKGPADDFVNVAWPKAMPADERTISEMLTWLCYLLAVGQEIQDT